MRQTIFIPLQPLTTATGTQHGQVVEIPSEVWQAIDAWHCIRDDDEADRVAASIQERMNDLCHPTD